MTYGTANFEVAMKAMSNGLEGIVFTVQEIVDLTCSLTKTNLQRLQRNDRAMIRQICSIKPEDVAVSSQR